MRRTLAPAPRCFDFPALQTETHLLLLRNDKIVLLLHLQMDLGAPLIPLPQPIPAPHAHGETGVLLQFLGGLPRTLQCGSGGK